MSATEANDVDELQLAMVQMKLQGIACRLVTRAEFAKDWRWRDIDRVVIYAQRHKKDVYVATIQTGYLLPDGGRGDFDNSAFDDALYAACMQLLGLDATWMSSGGNW